MTDLAALEQRHSVQLMAKRDLVLTAGRGAEVYDEAGRRYLDCVAGHGVASLGHGHPALVAALREQAGRLMSCAASFPNPMRARLLGELAALVPTPLNRSFLCNSGTEAVEAALKFARLSTGRHGVVAARRAFHGRTMGALSATFNPHYRRGLEDLLQPVDFVPFNDEKALAAAVNTECAAVLLEPIQGEGGVHVAETSFLVAARELCDRSGALLIFDEVQSGFCRSGRWFAFEHSGVVPDLVCVAKGMAGGFPMGAVICTDGIELPPASHGSTFGGNPLACAAALATIAEMRRLDLPETVAEMGRWLQEQLRGLEARLVRQVRGRGLLVGVDLRCRVQPIVHALQERGVLAMSAGATILRLLPPLTITTEQLSEVVHAIADCVGGTAAADHNRTTAPPPDVLSS